MRQTPRSKAHVDKFRMTDQLIALIRRIENRLDISRAISCAARYTGKHLCEGVVRFAPEHAS